MKSNKDLGNNIILIEYINKNGDHTSSEIEYNNISHCRLVIDTVDVFKSMAYIKLDNYSCGSVIKYINYFKHIYANTYTYEDFDLANYMGDEIYAIKVLDTLVSHSDISTELFELMVGTNHVKNYESQLLKCLNTHVMYDSDFRSFICTTHINKNKIINSDEDTNGKFKYLIGLITNAGIMTLLHNYVLWGHVSGTYLYILLLKQGLKNIDNMADLMQYIDKDKIFCREMVENYIDYNKSVGILISHIFNLKNKITSKFKHNIIKYRLLGIMGATGATGTMGYASHPPPTCGTCYGMNLYH